MIDLNSSNRRIRNILSKFGQGAFFITHSTTQSIPNAFANTGLLLDTEVIDVCSWVAASAGGASSTVFTPKQPGYYLLFGQVYVPVSGDFTDGTTNFYLWVRKNAAAAIPANAAATLREGVQLTCVSIVESNGSTDTFDLGVSHDAAGALACSRTSFGGVFVSYDNP